MGKRVGIALVLAVALAVAMTQTAEAFYLPCDGWWDCILKSIIL